MLFIEKYRPKDFSEIVDQEEVCELMKQFADKKNMPHLLISGVHGSGKSSAAIAMLNLMYNDSWEDNTTIFRTADLMDMGRDYLEKEEHFSQLYESGKSFLSNIKYIISTYAATKPINAEYKVMLFEDAYALSHDVQHSLRRTMERYSKTCRFIFVTTNASSLIPPISSRCLPIFFKPVTNEGIKKKIQNIAKIEQKDDDIISDIDIDVITAAAGGDLRKAIMYLEVRIATGNGFNPATLIEGETSLIVNAALKAMRSRDVKSAQKRLESLMIEYGLSGRETLRQFHDAVVKEYNDPKIMSTIADTDYILTHAGNEYIQMNAMAAKIVDEVFF